MSFSSEHLIEQQSLKDIIEVAQYHKTKHQLSWGFIHQKMLQDALHYQRWDAVNYFFKDIPWTNLNTALYNHWCTHFPPQLDQLIPLALHNNRLLDLFQATINPRNNQVRPYCTDLLPHFSSLEDRVNILNTQIHALPIEALDILLAYKDYEQNHYGHWTFEAIEQHKWENAQKLVTFLDREQTFELLRVFDGWTGGPQEMLLQQLNQLTLQEKNQLEEATSSVKPSSSRHRL